MIVERELIFPNTQPKPPSRHRKSLFFIQELKASLNAILSVSAEWLIKSEVIDF